MVTIEQKLTLFSKLLNQDIKEEMDEKFAQLDKEYEKRIAESKFEADKAATQIVEQARKRAEIKMAEYISKGKLARKKELMQLKEEMIVSFMNALYVRVGNFIETDAYLTYLKELIGQLKELKQHEHPIEVYITQRDYQENLEFIKGELLKLNIEPSKLSFKVATTPILGGFMIIDPTFNTRMDQSILATIEEAKEQIIEKISRTIGEVGEALND